MKIIADENMPQVAALFGAFGEVVTAPGRAITPALVADADVLLVRSVTRVNAQLLAGSPVRFVGTATIGTDHLDLPWLAEQGITWASAPGCNAAAVADYVIATLAVVAPNWRHKQVGIVGCGNVGAGLYRRLAALGVECRCYDPFLDTDSELPQVSFDELLAADILCLHTPLTRTGSYPTWHLFDAEVLARLKPGTVLLNAGRGDVVDNQALLQAIEKNALRVILDVWEGEPTIDTQLLAQVMIGSPHIAGYSLEGRLRGSLMVYDALRQWCGEGPVVELAALLEALPQRAEPHTLLAGSVATSVNDWLLKAYDPRVDYAAMQRALAAASGPTLGAAFDQLRKDYPWRREFSHFVVPNNLPADLQQLLSAAGFQEEVRGC